MPRAKKENDDQEISTPRRAARSTIASSFNEDDEIVKSSTKRSARKTIASLEVPAFVSPHPIAAKKAKKVAAGIANNEDEAGDMDTSRREGKSRRNIVDEEEDDRPKITKSGRKVKVPQHLIEAESNKKPKNTELEEENISKSVKKLDLDDIKDRRITKSGRKVKAPTFFDDDDSEKTNSPPKNDISLNTPSKNVTTTPTRRGKSIMPSIKNEESSSHSTRRGKSMMPLSNEDQVITNTPSKRGRSVMPPLEEEIVVNTPSKRGRSVMPLKEEEVVVSTPAKRGRSVMPLKEDEVVVSTPSKRGKPAIASPKEEEIVATTDSKLGRQALVSQNEETLTSRRSKVMMPPPKDEEIVKNVTTRRGKSMMPSEGNGIAPSTPSKRGKSMMPVVSEELPASSPSSQRGKSTKPPPNQDEVVVVKSSRRGKSIMPSAKDETIAEETKDQTSTSDSFIIPVSLTDEKLTKSGRKVKAPQFFHDFDQKSDETEEKDHKVTPKTPSRRTKSMAPSQALDKVLMMNVVEENQKTPSRKAKSKVDDMPPGTPPKNSVDDHNDEKLTKSGRKIKPPPFFDDNGEQPKSLKKPRTLLEEVLTPKSMKKIEEEAIKNETKELEKTVRSGRKVKPAAHKAQKSSRRLDLEHKTGDSIEMEVDEEHHREENVTRRGARRTMRQPKLGKVLEENPEDKEMKTQNKKINTERKKNDEEVSGDEDIAISLEESVDKNANKTKMIKIEDMPDAPTSKNCAETEGKANPIQDISDKNEEKPMEITENEPAGAEKSIKITETGVIAKKKDEDEAANDQNQIETPINAVVIPEEKSNPTVIADVATKLNVKDDDNKEIEDEDTEIEKVAAELAPKSSEVEVESRKTDVAQEEVTTASQITKPITEEEQHRTPEILSNVEKMVKEMFSAGEKPTVYENGFVSEDDTATNSNQRQQTEGDSQCKTSECKENENEAEKTESFPLAPENEEKKEENENPLELMEAGEAGSSAKTINSNLASPEAPESSLQNTAEEAKENEIDETKMTESLPLTPEVEEKPETKIETEMMEVCETENANSTSPDAAVSLFEQTEKEKGNSPPESTSEAEDLLLATPEETERCSVDVEEADNLLVETEEAEDLLLAMPEVAECTSQKTTEVTEVMEEIEGSSLQTPEEIEGSSLETPEETVDSSLDTPEETVDSPLQKPEETADSFLKTPAETVKDLTEITEEAENKETPGEIHSAPNVDIDAMKEEKIMAEVLISQHPIGKEDMEPVTEVVENGTKLEDDAENLASDGPIPTIYESEDVLDIGISLAVEEDEINEEIPNISASKDEISVAQPGPNLENNELQIVNEISNVELTSEAVESIDTSPEVLESKENPSESESDIYEIEDESKCEELSVSKTDEDVKIVEESKDCETIVIEDDTPKKPITPCEIIEDKLNLTFVSEDKPGKLETVVEIDEEIIEKMSLITPAKTPSTSGFRRKRSMSYSQDRTEVSGSIHVRRKRSLSEHKELGEDETPSKVAKIVRTKVPNFSAIHQQQFKKMESIAEYSKRKEVRAKLMASAKTPTASHQNKTPQFTDKSHASVKGKKLITLQPVEEITKFKSKKLNDTTTVLPNEKINKVLDRQIKHAADFKKKPTEDPTVAKTKRTDLVNKVRMNRRFELLMKFREKETQDNNDH